MFREMTMGYTFDRVLQFNPTNQSDDEEVEFLGTFLDESKVIR